jgi:hypothetical protein
MITSIPVLRVEEGWQARAARFRRLAKVPVPGRDIGRVNFRRRIVDGKHTASRKEVFRVYRDQLILRISVVGYGKLFYRKDQHAILAITDKIGQTLSER